MSDARGAPDRAPLVLLAEPAVAVTGPYTALAAEGRRLLGDELARRLTRAGARVVPVAAAPEEGFRWGRWFANAARPLLAEGDVDMLGYATAGSLALVDDEFLRALLSPDDVVVVANNRFSADAFVVRGDVARAVSVLEEVASDNAAVRCLADAGFAATDLSDRPFASADADTPQDLELLRLGGATTASRSIAELPRVGDLGRVVRDRNAEIVVAGRVSTSTARYVESETACRVRLFIEERGMRAGPGAPRSLLAAWLDRHGATALIEQLGSLGDAVVLDTRVLMATIGRSSDAAAWPPAEERFASDFLDASVIETPWLRDLTEAASASQIPVLVGAHLLVNDGLRILVQRAWEAADLSESAPR
ncbi:MAG: hypothetical protein ABR509_04350 [Candidatus Limnocylindria bacterium]